MATPPFTREELHECTLKYVLKGVARRLYDAANSDLQKRRMVTSVARSSPSSNISINHPHKNINSKARHGFKSSPIKISSYAFTKKDQMIRTKKNRTRLHDNYHSENKMTSLENMNEGAQQSLSQIRCFCTILIPTERFAANNNDITK